jgi:hypothetical protein
MKEKKEGNNSNITRILLVVWMLFALAFITKKGIVEGWNNRGGDFNNYYVSSVLVAKGIQIHLLYNNDFMTARANNMGIEEGAKFSPFPPVTAYLYLPISSFEFMTAKRIWLVLNTLLLLWLPFRIRRIFKLSTLKALFISSLFFIPLASNLNFGQAYLLLTFVMIEAIGLVYVRQKERLAAVLLAICALLKYFPLLFIMYFFKDEEGKKSTYKALREQKWMLPFFAFILILTAYTHFIYPEAYKVYFGSFFDHMNGDLSGQGKFAIGFQSIDSLLNNLFVYDAKLNPNPFVNMVNLKLIFKMLVFGLIGLFSFLIFKKDRYRYTAINSSIFIFGAFALVPASASYHFLFLIVPVIYLFNWIQSFKSQRHLVFFVLMLLFVFVVQTHHIPHIAKPETFNLLIHYPRLWSLLFLFGYLSFLKLGPRHG